MMATDVNVTEYSVMANWVIIPELVANSVDLQNTIAADVLRKAGGLEIVSVRVDSISALSEWDHRWSGTHVLLVEYLTSKTIVLSK
jgi:hypothetical protein